MKFVLPSVDYLVDQTKATGRRFPGTLAFAAAAFSVAVTVVQRGSGGANDDLVRLLTAFILGIPLALAARLYRESRGGPAWIQALPPVIIGLVYLLFRRLPTQGMLFLFAQLGLVFHLAVSFALVWADDEERFWQMNRVLFLRFIATGVFSNTIFAGVALCLGSLKLLFKWEIPGEIYLDLWYFCVFIFNTLFFCAGVPTKDSLPRLQGDYPRLLKIFCQYVLVPLLAVYGVILYAYLARVIVHWEIPKGQAAALISGFSIAGMLTNLLLHPLAEKPENRWMRIFGTGFYGGLPPLLGLMAVALYQRIAPYALTENRYILCLLCLWLFGVAVFFLASRSRRIKVVPVSLACLALLTAFGPLGVRAVAERSQLKRLLALLKTNGRLGPDGVIQKADKDLTFEDGKEASGIFDYLLSRHGWGRLKAHLPAAVVASVGEKEAKKIADEKAPSGAAVMQALGMAYHNRWESPTNEDSLNFYGRSDNGGAALDVRGFEGALLNVEWNLSGAKPSAEGWSAGPTGPGAGRVTLFDRGREVWSLDLLDYAAKHRDAFTEKGNPKMRPVTIGPVDGEIRAVFVVETLNATLSPDRPRVTYLKGHLFWARSKS